MTPFASVPFAVSAKCVSHLTGDRSGPVQQFGTNSRQALSDKSPAGPHDRSVATRGQPGPEISKTDLGRIGVLWLNGESGSRRERWECARSVVVRSPGPKIGVGRRRVGRDTFSVSKVQDKRRWGTG